MAKMIFLNLPVADVAKATAFYEAIGATKDERFSQEGAGAAVTFSDTIHFMLLSHARFGDFTPKKIPDTATHTEVLICLSEDSREAVDATLDKVAAAGGCTDPSPPDDYGWMYGRSFEDLDGHSIQVMWMDMDAATAAMSASGEPVAA